MCTCTNHALELCVFVSPPHPSLRVFFRANLNIGYVHSAFTFGYESHVNRSKIDGSQIPPGALLSFMQRGINFVEIEESIVNGTENGTSGTSAMDGVTSLLDVHKCLRSEDFKKGKPDRAAGQRANSNASEGMDIDDKDDDGSPENSKNDMNIPASDTLTLRGHRSEVFVCAWNPRTSLLASGSGDSTARIWPIPTSLSSATSASAAGNTAQPIVLEHSPAAENSDGKDRPRANDVTTLQWNPTGQMLATGCYDGCARLWTVNGTLKHTLELHKGPLFSLKWNKAGNYVLSGSVDRTTAVWDGETGRLVKQFTFHNAPTLDVDWRNNESFASCSTDKMIFLCSLEQPQTPVQIYEGHRDEINCLKFDPSGKLLASCSDDYTAKIWTANSSYPAHDLKEHTREVYTMQWAPNTGQLVLATASFDAMIKLWDVTTGGCIRTLAAHTDPVYSLDFSPNGQFLASGSFDRCLNIWSVKEGRVIKQFRGDGGIFEVTWHPDGDKVAACFSSNTVCVIDLRKMTASTTKL